MDDKLCTKYKHKSGGKLTDETINLINATQINSEIPLKPSVSNHYDLLGKLYPR
jgi:hypothetical protein